MSDLTNDGLLARLANVSTVVTTRGERTGVVISTDDFEVTMFVPAEASTGAVVQDAGGLRWLKIDADRWELMRDTPRG